MCLVGGVIGFCLVGWWVDCFRSLVCLCVVLVGWLVGWLVVYFLSCFAGVLLAFALLCCVLFCVELWCFVVFVVVCSYQHEPLDALRDAGLLPSRNLTNNKQTNKQTSKQTNNKHIDRQATGS